jgi:hypothetical protein
MKSGASRWERMILGEPVVFFRKEDGAPVAFKDRCAHRHLPLSMGKLLGDTCNAAITGCATTVRRLREGARPDTIPPADGGWDAARRD